mgnify:CR=1 FL=1
MENTGSRIEVLPRLDDPIWRIQNLYLIVDKNARVCQLRFNRIQDILYSKIQEDIETGRPLDLSILKFRQGGVSTFFLLLHLDRTIFNPNLSTCILADLWKNLKYLFGIIKFAHESMVDSLRPELGEDTKYAMSFPGNRSRIFVDLEVKSTAIHGLHISEHAYIEEENVNRSLMACAPDAWVTSETTGNGMNHYEKRWKRGRAIGRKQIFIPWPLQQEYRIPKLGDPDDHLPPLIRRPDEERLAGRMLRDFRLVMDDRQFRYRRKVKEDLGRFAEQDMAEDEDVCFLSTGGAFFDNRKIRVLLSEARKALEAEPAIQEDDHELVLEKPTPRCLYAAGADVAEGIETGADKDYSVLVIFCVKHRRVAYRYRGRVAVDTFYRHSAKKCAEYNMALFAPEVNGTYGGSMITGLRDVCKYPNIYFEDKQTRIVNNKNLIKKVYGWETTRESKPLMLTQLRLALEGKSEDDENSFMPEFLVLDREFLEETLSVVQEGIKIYARTGHDDLTMAYAIAYQMYRVAKGSEFRIEDIRAGGNLESADQGRGNSEGDAWNGDGGWLPA